MYIKPSSKGFDFLRGIQVLSSTEMQKLKELKIFPGANYFLIQSTQLRDNQKQFTTWVLFRYLW